MVYQKGKIIYLNQKEKEALTSLGEENLIDALLKNSIYYGRDEITQKLEMIISESFFDQNDVA